MIDMEMHHIRYFLAVYKVKNFTTASKQCCVAQPSLSKAIKQLEQELGGALFTFKGAYFTLKGLNL